jgi:hypothetical protein
MRFHYCSPTRWQAIAEADELSISDDPVNDELPLSDETRVRIAVRMRRDAKRRVPVPSTRWHDVVDRATGETMWCVPGPCGRRGLGRGCAAGWASSTCGSSRVDRRLAESLAARWVWPGPGRTAHRRVWWCRPAPRGIGG